MTEEEFNNLEVGDKVYHFTYPNINYISTFSAAIGKKIIKEKKVFVYINVYFNLIKSL